jgi:double-strand break repair protein MRE11
LLEAYGGSIDNVKVEKLVQEFLINATLEILPSNGLGDAVGQFVDKDDKHAVEMFVEDSLKSYLTKLREIDDLNEETISEVVEQQKSYLEQLFAKGLVKPKRVCRPDSKTTSFLNSLVSLRPTDSAGVID